MRGNRRLVGGGRNNGTHWNSLDNDFQKNRPIIFVHYYFTLLFSMSLVCTSRFLLAIHTYLNTVLYNSNPGGGEIFRTRPDRRWGPPSLLYNGYRVFPEGKAAGAWCWPHTPFQRRCHERLEPYLYPPSGPVQACNGTALPLLLPLPLPV
jgi:hypothetical protein